MNILEKLTNLREEKQNYKNEIEYLTKEELSEIQIAKKIIEEKYREDKEVLNEKFKFSYKKIEEQCKMIEKYSEFNIRNISKVLSDLIRIYEDKNYILQNTYYHADPKRNILVEAVSILIKENKIISDRYYQFHYFKSLLKHGEALLLIEKNISNNIKFYKYNGNYDILQTVKYGKFNYIKEFIDYVISYKIENRITDISIDELEKLKIEFIKLHVNDIYTYHDELLKNEERDYKKNKEKKKKHREKLLKKVLYKNM